MKEKKHKTNKNTAEFDQENPYFGPFGILTAAFLITWVITTPLDFRIILVLFSSALFVRKFWVLFHFSFFLVFLIQFITIKLDKKYNWKENFKQRLVKQLLHGCLFPLLLYYLVYFTFIVLKILPKATHGHNLILAVLVLNTVYGAHYGLNTFTTSYAAVNKKPETAMEGAEEQLDGPSPGTYNVPFGYGFTPVAYEDIAYFWREDNHVYMRHLDGNQSILKEPLDKIEGEQQNDYFFRITRDYLAAKRSIVSAKVNKKRGFTIELDNNLVLDLARKKTSSFEAWYGPVRKKSLIKSGIVENMGSNV